ncbi:VOC family protein [Rheinheimera sp.]|uniref:VOC family protein n=1 Tax=Rheinheimera sp. TaxID=1869214 RepID=UPI00307F3D8F
MSESTQLKHHQLNYAEFPCRDLCATKAFFAQVFGWSFTDYGPDYTAFAHSGLDGGFFRSEQMARTANGSALLVLYSTHLEATQAAVEQAGGQIIQPIFSFPGGRRFHFTEPSGNEFAVWSE